MALTKEDITEIRELIGEVLTEQQPKTTNNNVHYELEIRERTLRVEEGLKHQRELMQEGFKRMDQRFEQMENRDREAPRDASPPTPPGIRVTYHGGSTN